MLSGKAVLDGEMLAWDEERSCAASMKDLLQVTGYDRVTHIIFTLKIIVDFVIENLYWMNEGPILNMDAACIQPVC